MLNKQDFALIRKELSLYDKKRDDIIKKSRDVVSLSKKVIYSVHRLDMKSAEADAKKMKEALKELSKMMGGDALLLSQGSFKVAEQEFVEAMCFFEFVKNAKIPTSRELGVENENYLAGLCDLTGELVRKAINSAIKEDYGTSVIIKDFVSGLYGEMMLFDFRNGDLRRKFDSIKYDLKKLEDLVLQLKLQAKI